MNKPSGFRTTLQDRCVHISIIVFLGFLALFFYPTTVKAQEKAGFSVSPPTFELAANPGDTIENTIRVENLSDFDITLKLSKKDFLAIGDEGAVELVEDNGTFSLASWIEFTESERTIAARKSALIPFKVNIPSNAEPGGHFASVVMGTVPKGDVGQSGATLSQEIGVLLLLRIAGKANENATISSLTVPKFSEYGPINFELLVKNDGNVHVKPTGGITITNILGKKVGNVDITPKNVLPNASRKLSATLDKKYLFGPYTATTSLVYGTDNKLITASTSFFVLPYKLVLGTLVVLVLIILGAFKVRKRLKAAAKALMAG